MPLKFAMYNTHLCNGNDKAADPGRIAAVLREIDADAVALQEVASTPEASSSFLDLPFQLRSMASQWRE